MITTVCKISYGSQTVPPIVPAVQGDTGRAISFEIADFTPPAGATATYFILKPSGEAIYNSATITNNSILCELTAQSLAEAGENRMQVRVLQGEDIVTSFEVILMVRTFLGDDAIESGTEMNIFDQAVEQATEDFQTNAEQIVEEVIESIPSDYTALTEEVDELNERMDDEIADLKNALIPFPTDENPKYGDNGQLLRTLGNGQTQWVDVGLPTDEQTERAVSNWLDDHPEATTTVQDASLTEAKFTDALKKKTIKDYATPQMYGAIGDGIADDTLALYNALTNNDCVVIPEGNYLCDWDAILLENKILIGTNKETSIITQKNKDIPFCRVGTGTQIKNIKFVTSGENTIPTAVLHLGKYNSETYTNFSNHIIENVMINGDQNIIGILYNMNNVGGSGSTLNNLVFRNCYCGIQYAFTNVGDTHNSWVTKHVINNIYVLYPYDSGFSIINNGNRYQLSQCTFSNIFVTISRADTVGFRLNSGGYLLLNPCVFNDNATGNGYSLEFKYDTTATTPQNRGGSTWKANIISGNVEGLVLGEELMNNYMLDNVTFIKRANASETLSIERVANAIVYQNQLTAHGLTYTFTKKGQCIEVKIQGILTEEFTAGTQYSLDFSTLPQYLPTVNYTSDLVLSYATKILAFVAINTAGKVNITPRETVASGNSVNLTILYL